LDSHGDRLSVGGIETYLVRLSELCVELGFEVWIIQHSLVKFVKDVGRVRVVGITEKRPRRIKRRLLNEALRLKPGSNDLVIFGTDRLAANLKETHSVSIQHGIAWDLPIEYYNKRIGDKYSWFARVRIWKARLVCLRNFRQCPNRVCVDYNFLNWYKTYKPGELDSRVWVIPNFSQIADRVKVLAKHSSQGSVRVLFARRFEQYRGTRLFASVVKRLLAESQNIEVSFLGEGSEEAWLRSTFEDFPRVTFGRYHPDDSAEAHLAHHIAVIPSIGSEGTSFAVAEAMAAGCCIVASHVGGITNMIINGYNGILVAPDTTSLYQGLRQVIHDGELRRRLGTTAYETAVYSFSTTRWKEAWKEVIAILLSSRKA
jgi:glycosyltransferase involved in cell wall biosynthesis